MSTATPPPAGTPPKRPSQSGNLFLLLLVLTGLILLWVGADLWTPELAGVRVVRRDADSMIRRDAGLVRAKLAREPFDGDLDHWSQSRLPIADEVADAQLRMMLVNEQEVNPARLEPILHYDGTPITARFIIEAIAEHVRADNVEPIGKKGLAA